VDPEQLLPELARGRHIILEPQGRMLHVMWNGPLYLYQIQQLEFDSEFSAQVFITRFETLRAEWRKIDQGDAS